MAKKRHTFEEIQQLDEEILAIATYEAAGGMLFIPKSPDDLISFNVKIARNFNHFKALLRAGEVNIFELKDLVFTKNGAVPQGDEEDIDKLIEGIERENIERDSEEKFVDKISAQLKDLFALPANEKEPKFKFIKLDSDAFNLKSPTPKPKRGRKKKGSDPENDIFPLF